jgi:hypothetical protein
MFKLTPLTAAILVIVSAQAMADDSVSTQNQFGTANIADVKQSSAPFSTATQQQLGEGNDHDRPDGPCSAPDRRRGNPCAP